MFDQANAKLVLIVLTFSSPALTAGKRFLKSSVHCSGNVMHYLT